MYPGLAIVALWILWALSWAVAALWANASEKRAGLGAELRYRVPMLVGVALMAVPAHGYDGVLRLWHVGWTGAWFCVGLVALGIAFAWWARLHLGRLWSGAVTRKANHRIIDTGPYAIVRHPIYTGLLLSLLATAAAKGTVPGLGGFAALFLGLWMKARLEERWAGAGTRGGGLRWISRARTDVDPVWSAHPLIGRGQRAPRAAGILPGPPVARRPFVDF